MAGIPASTLGHSWQEDMINEGDFDATAAFAEGATGTVKGRSELAELWLEHLLLLSMLQHTSGRWRWGRWFG